MKALDFARTWYRGYLPRTLDVEFRQFAARSATLAGRIAVASMKIDSKSQSAYTDGKTIFIPGLYFLPDFYSKLGITDMFDKPAAAITAINGSMIHEALHISLSHCNMEDMVDHDERAKELLKSSRGFSTILGLVEDLFIENFGKHSYRRIYNFVRGKNELIFSEREYVDRLTTFSEQADQYSLLNVLLCRKNTLLDEHEGWSEFEQFTSLLDTAKQLSSTNEDRVALALQIYDLFENEDIEKSEQFSSPSESGDEGESDFVDEEILEMMLKISEELIEGIIREFDETIRIDKLDDFEKAKEKLRTIPPIMYEDVSVRLPMFGTPEISKDFSSFSSTFRYMYEEKHTLGRPNDTGTKIVKQRLHRILTDNKVLAYHDRKSVQRGKPKVILLADASGSTSGHLWSSERKAIYGAFLSLQKAGIAVSAYAHTSSYDSGVDSPIVFGIAAFNMPLGKTQRIVHTANVTQRFASLSGIRLDENYDGFAIDYVASCFPSNPGTNLLIVLSDGRPSGDGYYGEIAEAHTKGAIEKARKLGTKVLSISLVEHVYDSNNELYGKEFNVAAWDGKLEKSLQSVMMSLIK